MKYESVVPLEVSLIPTSSQLDLKLLLCTCTNLSQVSSPHMLMPTKLRISIDRERVNARSDTVDTFTERDETGLRCLSS